LEKVDHVVKESTGHGAIDDAMVVGEA
jgi:hypothetical protein